MKTRLRRLPAAPHAVIPDESPGRCWEAPGTTQHSSVAKKMSCSAAKSPTLHFLLYPGLRNIPVPYDDIPEHIRYYMQFVERSLLRENLKLTPQQRMDKQARMIELELELRAAGRQLPAKQNRWQTATSAQVDPNDEPSEFYPASAAVLTPCLTRGRGSANSRNRLSSDGSSSLPCRVLP